MGEIQSRLALFRWVRGAKKQRFARSARRRCDPVPIARLDDYRADGAASYRLGRCGR